MINISHPLRLCLQCTVNMQLTHYASYCCRRPVSGGQITCRVVGPVEVKSPKQRAVIVRSLDSDDDKPGATGSKMQEELVDMLQLELAKAKVREDIKSDLEQRKENLRKIGEELTEAFAKEIELDKMRMELASSSSLADTLAQFKELDDEVQKIRDDLKADQLDLADFETRSTTARNQGLFFKGLYKPEVTADTEEEGGRPTRAGAGSDGDGASSFDPELVARLRGQITEPAREELASPLRLYVFTYLAIVLGCVVASDVAGGTPNTPLDALYAVLAAGLTYTAVGERAALVAQGDANAAAAARAQEEAAARQRGSGSGQ